ncbi:MAG: GNAT family N-acetyltransferase [Gammaproteobacteria bacterium]|nr:GNAT family N-acetyltransferase [Gammaproteobacteria bacterium]
MSLLPLITDRLTLRRLSPDDLADFQLYRRDEEVGRYQGWLPQSDAEAAAFLETKGKAEFFQPGKWFQIGIAERETGTLIGDIGICLSAEEPEAEIGFSLRRQSQGMGLAKEAVSAAIAFIFEEADIRRIIGIVDARNAGAIKLLQKLGMQHIETKQAVFRGAPCEEHLFALYH